MSPRPKNSSEWVKEAVRYYKAECYTECLEACEEAIQLNPDCARAYHGKGLALTQRGRYEDALVAYQKVFQLLPENAQLGVALRKQLQVDITELLELLYMSGDYGRAGKAYRKAIKVDNQYESLYIDKTKELIDKARKLSTPETRDLALYAYRNVLHFNPNPNNDLIATSEIEAFKREEEAKIRKFEREEEAKARFDNIGGSIIHIPDSTNGRNRRVRRGS